MFMWMRVVALLEFVHVPLSRVCAGSLQFLRTLMFYVDVCSSSSLSIDA